MDDKVGIKRPLESPVPREEIDEDVSSIERHRSLDHNDLSDVADNNKVEKNRERNREHAKRTRQRKKEMMEGMKLRLLELQREAGRLEQLLEESNTASILLCLGTKPRSNNGEPPSIPNPESAEDLQAKLQVSRGNIIDHLRQRVRIEAAQNVKDKADVAVDEDEEVLEDKDSDNGEFDDETKNLESFSTSWKGGQQVEALLQDPVSGKSAFSSDDIKRERNRMHAKLTRDRKKLFTSRMQQTIQALERHNQMLKNKLQAMTPGSSGSTSNSAISTMDSSTPSDSAGMTTSMSSSSGSMNGSANNSGGTTPAASSSSRLQGSVASGTSAGITVPANSFSELPSGVIPVFPVKTGPNGVVSWMPTAALAWAAVAPPSANSSNNSATPTLYPIVTTVDGTLTGLPPISASLAQSFYQFQRNYFNAQNGNPTDGDSGDTSDGNRSNSNLAPAKDHP